MDAGYALLVEAYMQSNVPLSEAVSQIDEQGRMRAGEDTDTKEANVEAMNDAAFAELQKMMMGIG